MKVRLFPGKLLLPFAAFLLLAVSDLSSSSSSRAEDGFWFAHSQSSLEQLWSGVMGCADVASPPPPPPPNQYIRDRLDDDGSSVPTGTSSDYSQCGKLALRNTGSRILVDTIEDAVRSGGVALFNENFHLDSSVGWVWDEKVSGAFDAVIPLFSRERTNGLGYAFFLQPGGVFWQGLKEQDRIDGNLGLAFRSNLTPDVIAGASVFYDHDFRRGHQRAGVGVDLQSGALHTALNYYHPLNDWQEGRTDYEEQPLQGADFRLGLAWSRIRFDTSVAVWRFEREEEESTKWRPAFGIDAGYRILPGVFLEGGYESHDSDDSLDSRWNAGFAFRFSLPGLEGIKSYETMAEANLWEPVAREKRILYEEREAIPPVRLAAPTDESGEELTGLPEEGATITIPGELVALPEAIMLELAIDEEDSSAVLGEDFSYGHAVYELNAETGEQSAPDTVTDCPMATCQMMIPAGVSRFDVEIEILDDDSTAPREIPEEIVLQVNVPEEYQRMVRGGATTVGIQAHGNTVQFTEATSTLDENGGVTNVEVNANLASPSPITLDVTVTSTDAVLGTDYTIPSGSRLTIPANPDGEITSASLTLDGIDNNVGEGSKTITLTIPDDQSLPTGWTLGTQTTHTVTLQDDDLAIFFTEATRDRVDEPASDQSFTVTVGITQAPSVDIAVVVAAGGTGETASSSDDYTFTATELTFRSGMTTPQTATLTLLADTGTEAEPDEFIVLTLADKDDDATARNTDGFSLDGPHTVTIAANDNTVGFASNAVATLRERENNETVGVDVSISHAAPEDITLNVSVNTTTSTATEGTDFTLSPPTLTIPRGQTSGTIMLTSINNNDGEGSKRIDLTLSVSGSLPTGWAEGDLEHEVTLQDDDLSIFFVTGAGNTPSRVEEPASGNTSVTITVGITEAPSAPITVRVRPGGTGETATSLGAVGISRDYTFGFEDVMFTDSDHANKTFSFPIHSDTEAEPDEFIVLTIADMGTQMAREDDGFSLGSPHTITIPANNNTVGFVSNAVATLGENGGTANVEVSISSPAPRDITLNITATDDSNTVMIGRDYTILPRRSLTIPRGQTSGMIMLTGINNQRSEGRKNIDLTLSVVGSLPDGWIEGDLEHRVTLEDDDLSIYFVTGAGKTPSRVEEPASGGTPVEITVGITQAPKANINVAINTGGTGQNTQTGDITFSTPTITFMPGGALEQTVTPLMVLQDNAADADEFIVLRLVAPDGTLAAEESNFSLGPNHTITIPANDNTVAFASGTSTFVEGVGTTANVTVNVTEPASVPITVDVEVLTASTATEDTDFTIADSLTIGANQSSGMITLTGLDDDLIEGNETIMLRISEPSGSPWPDEWDIGSQTTHTVTLQDDDLRISFVPDTDPSVTPHTPSEVEEPASDQSVTIAVGINHAPTDAITVRVTAAGLGNNGQTAEEGTGNDYTFTATDLVFPANMTASKTATLMVLHDDEPEDAETIVLTLTEVGTSLADEGSNFSLGDSYTITIPANERVVRFASGTSTLAESATATREVTVEVVPPAPVDITLDVEVLTTGTATEDTDFTVDSSLTIGANQPSDTITVRSREDNLPEGPELITLEISEPLGSSLPDGWTFGTTMHTVTLQDNETEVYFVTSVIPSEVEEPASGSTPVTVTVGITQPPSAEIKVKVGTAGLGNSGQTAEEGAGKDYTLGTNGEVELTFPAGSTFSRTVTLMVLDDADPENDQTIVLTLADPDGTLVAEGGTFSLGDDHTITIPANDRTVSFAMGESTLAEGIGTTREVTVEVVPPAPVDITLDVDVTGSATKGEDFAISTEMLTIGANQPSETITLTGMEDMRIEGNETVILEISEPLGSSLPDGWTFGTTTHTVTLQDNETEILFVTSGANAIPSEVSETDIDKTVSIGVRITRAPTAPINVRVEVDGSSSAQASDYNLPAPDIMFTETGPLEQSITLTILSDTVPDEMEETIVLKLTEPDNTLMMEGSNFSLGDDHTITIPANKTEFVISLSGSSNVVENIGTSRGTSTVSISRRLSQSVTVDLDVSGTATGGASGTNGIDYETIPSTVNIPAMANSVFLPTITFIDDNIDEPAETIVLEISAPSGGFPHAGVVLGENTRATFTIHDNDIPANTIGFATNSETTANEGDTQNTTGAAEIFLEGTAGLTQAVNVNVNIAVSGVSDTSPYTLYAVDNFLGPVAVTGGAITIDAGRSSNLRLELDIPEDNSNTNDETITLTLTEGANFPSGWTLGSTHKPATWTIMVNDND